MACLLLWHALFVYIIRYPLKYVSSSNFLLSQMDTSYPHFLYVVCTFSTGFLLLFPDVCVQFGSGLLGARAFLCLFLADNFHRFSFLISTIITHGFYFARFVSSARLRFSDYIRIFISCLGKSLFFMYLKPRTYVALGA